MQKVTVSSEASDMKWIRHLPKKRDFMTPKSTSFSLSINHLDWKEVFLSEYTT